MWWAVKTSWCRVGESFTSSARARGPVARSKGAVTTCSSSEDSSAARSASDFEERSSFRSGTSEWALTSSFSPSPLKVERSAS